MEAINNEMENNGNDHHQSPNEAPTTSESVEGNESNEESTTETEQKSNGGTMKLVIRSPYWGRVLKGKTRRDPHNPTKPYRIFQCQAVLNNEGRYWGCCPNHGKRVFELKEYHFTEHYSHDWDLYMMGSSVTPTHIVHSFFLLPQNQSVVNISRHLHFDGWSFFGTVSASALRLDLEGLLYDFLIQNKDVGFNYHHVHVDLLMDQVTDREAAATRQKTEARRAERAKQNNIKAPLPGSGNHPPIPHVVSNDASWATETTVSSSTTSLGGYDSWGEAFHPAYGYRSPNASWPSQTQWISAAAAISTIPNHHHGPLPPIQQALQTFPMPMNMPPFPVGFVPPPYYAQLEHTGAPEWALQESVPYCVPAIAYAQPAPQDGSVP